VSGKNYPILGSSLLKIIPEVTDDDAISVSSVHMVRAWTDVQHCRHCCTLLRASARVL